METREIEDKIKALTERHRKVTNKQSSLKGTLAAKKAELSRLVEEIKAAGYDPKNLAKELSEVKAQLLKDIQATEDALATAEKAIAEIEGVES